MGKFVLVYTGGGMGDTQSERQESMTEWMNWFASLGTDIVDGGNPFGSSSTVGSDGNVADGGASNLTGYSIISAVTLGEAGAKARGCPVLASGGSVEVYEAVPIG